MKRKRIKYKDYQKMIIKLSHQYAMPGIIGMEFNDLYSLGNEIFVITKKKYQRKKGSFSTSLYNMIQRRFYWMKINAAKNKHNKFFKNNIIIDNEICDGINTIKEDRIQSYNIDMEKQFMFFESLNALSTDSKEIVSLVLDMPCDLKNHVVKDGNGRVSKSRIQNYLIDNGWGYERIWASFAEIKGIL